MEVDSDVGSAPHVSSSESDYFPTPGEEFEHFKQNERPKFNYPKAEKHREHTTARSPPHLHPRPTSKLKPKPKPRKATPLQTFEALTQPHLSFADFMQCLLTQYPHPHPNDKTWTLIWLSELSSLKLAMQCRKLRLVCHIT